ncbi:MAG: hypothetical protein ABI883_08430, partial [Chthoniobacterales bacterium]
IQQSLRRSKTARPFRMKMFVLAKTAVLSAALSSLVVGCTTAQPVARNTAGGLILDNTERVAVVTGSNVPQKVRVKSIGTDSAQNVRVITQKEIISSNGGFGVGGVSSLGGR